MPAETNGSFSAATIPATVLATVTSATAAAAPVPLGTVRSPNVRAAAHFAVHRPARRSTHAAADYAAVALDAALATTTPSNAALAALLLDITIGRDAVLTAPTLAAASIAGSTGQCVTFATLYIAIKQAASHARVTRVTTTAFQTASFAAVAPSALFPTSSQHRLIKSDFPADLTTSAATAPYATAAACAAVAAIN